MLIVAAAECPFGFSHGILAEHKIMELVFEEVTNRNQCGCKLLLNGTRTQCKFSTSTVVTIPAGLSYLNGKLERTAAVPAPATFPICQNHKARLKSAFAGMF
jgi:hypothetical protein